MIPFKINGKRYDFPTRWPDVTYSQYIALLRATSITDHLSIFTGIPVQTLEASELKNLEKISLAISFLSFSPKFDRTPMVGPYVLPADCTVQSTVQFEALRLLMFKMPADLKTIENLELFAELTLHACAVYVQKIKNRKYKPELVPEVKEELKNYSCAEVIGTGSFFLFKPANTSKPITNPFLKLIQRLKRLKQD